MDYNKENKYKILLFDKGPAKTLFSEEYDNEKELQKLVKDNPSVVEIESIFDSPLLVIGREALKIDILGLTLSGVPVIIECKKKENPDMRYLIAQVFEYGSKLKNKTFDEIERLAREYFNGEQCKEEKYKNKSLLEALKLLKEEYPGFEDSTDEDLQETIYKNLSNGNFFLIVVADEVDDITRGTINYLNSKLNDVRIEIIEIKKFKQKENNTFILVPQHTNPNNTSNLKTRISIGDTSLDEIKNKGTSKQSDAVDIIVRHWKDKEDCFIKMGASGLAMWYKDLSVFYLYTNRVQLSSFLKNHLDKKGLSEIYNSISSLLKTKYNDTTVKTEELDPKAFCSVINEIVSRLGSCGI